MNRCSVPARAYVAFVGSLSVLVLASLCVLEPITMSEAVAAKKKLDRRKGDGNRDGKNTVDGAIWKFEATSGGSGKQVQFTYRVSDAVLYDVGAGKVIGGIKPLAKGRSQVTFSDASPFPGTFDIQLIRISHWKGQATRSGESWAIRLTCLDR